MNLLDFVAPIHKNEIKAMEQTLIETSHKSAEPFMISASLQVIIQTKYFVSILFENK